MKLKTRVVGPGLLLALAVGVLVAWGRHNRIVSEPSADAVAKNSPGPEHATPTMSATQPVPATAIPADAATNSTREQFVAPRYDSSHVIFLDSTTEDSSDLKTLERLHKLKPAVAELAGLENLYDVDADFVHQHPQLLKIAHTGEEWQLQISAGSTVQVVIEKPVIAMLGCMVAGGFLAKVTPNDEERLSSSSENYFVISHAQSPGSTTQAPSRIGELKDWKADSDVDARIRKLLESAMRQELTKVRTKMAPEYDRSEAANPGWSQEWKKNDEQLASGEGQLTYRVQGFQLMSDGVPRLYGGAQWMIRDKVAFLFTAWVRGDASLAIESVSSRESEWMRTTEFDNPLDLEHLPKILNVFEDRATGNGQLLMYSTGLEAFNLDLLRYTDKGPVPMDVGVSLSGGC